MLSDPPPAMDQPARSPKRNKAPTKGKLPVTKKALPTGDVFEDLVSKIDKFLYGDEAALKSARVSFRRIIQRDNELIDEYFLRLQQGIRLCNWDANVAGYELREQLLSQGLPRTVIARLVLENAPVERILETVRVEEAALAEQNQRQQRQPAVPVAVMQLDEGHKQGNRARPQSNQRQPQNNRGSSSPAFSRNSGASSSRNAPCKGCGKNCASRSACGAFNKTCTYCNIKGHFQSVCKKKIKDQQSSAPRKRSINHVYDDDDDWRSEGQFKVNN